MADKSAHSEDLKIAQARLVLDLRKLGISNTTVLKAMEQVPRELFLPDELQDHAYSHRMLPLPCGEMSLLPFDLARMLQALRPQTSDHVFVLGAGMGYVPAVLSRCVKKVYAVERYKTLLLEAEKRLKRFATINIISKQGDGLEGWAEQGPFDAMLILSAISEVPSQLLEQLRRPAKIVFPALQPDGQIQLALMQLPKTGGENLEFLGQIKVGRAISGVAKSL